MNVQMQIESAVTVLLFLQTTIILPLHHCSVPVHRMLRQSQTDVSSQLLCLLSTVIVKCFDLSHLPLQPN